MLHSQPQSIIALWQVISKLHSISVTCPTDGGPPCHGSGAYGLRVSCRFRFRNPKGRRLL